MEIFSQLFNALPGSISQGLIWGIMAIGVYITYRILDVADLTVDGSFATGGAVAVMLILNGCNLWLAMLVAFIAGLQGIDSAQFEAGAVDGIKNRWQELWYITLPVMKPQLMFGAVMAITGSFGFGAVVDALCGL